MAPIDSLKLRPSPRTFVKSVKRSVCSPAATGRRYASRPNAVMNWVAQVVSAALVVGVAQGMESLPAVLPAASACNAVSTTVLAAWL
jgi:hypothetical protein